MKKAIFYILFALVVASCGNKEKEVVNTYADGQPQKIQYVKWKGNNKEVHKVEYFYPNGTTESIIRYDEEKKSGKSEYYFKNGELRLEENYKEGLLNGESVEYYKSGEINYKANYKNGIPDGEWVYYYQKGLLFPQRM